MERGKNETEKKKKKGVKKKKKKKKFQCGSRTRDLLICSRHIATASGIDCTYYRHIPQISMDMN